MIRRNSITRRHSRRGYVLVLFAMLFWVILGMAALVIDLGLARVKLRQMQTATDTAAIEALRGGYATSTPDSNEALDDAYRFFAYALDNRGNQFNWSTVPTTYETREVRYDNPNRANQLVGPKLSDPRVSLPLRMGEFIASQTDSNESVRAVYRRGTTTEGENASPALPWLFGRGTFLHHTNTNDLLQRGMTFQAESLAKTNPTMTFGAAVPSAGFEGVTLACDASDWPDSPMIWDIPSAERGLLLVGTELSPGTPRIPDATTSAYVAIVADNPADIANRVIGFGRLENGDPVDAHVVAENATCRWMLDQADVPQNLWSQLLEAQHTLLYPGEDEPPNRSLVHSPALAPTPFTPATAE